MQQTTWTQRLAREVEFGRFRYLVIGLLLGVGLLFWVPQLQQLSLTSPSASIPLDVTHRRTTPRPAVETTTSFVNDKQRPLLERPSTHNSSDISAVDVDPVARSVEMVAIPGKLFPRSLNNESSQRPSTQPGSLVLNVVTSDSIVETSVDGTQRGLKVQDTIIGVQRRAVVVNDQLYFEGDFISAENQQFQIVGVEEGEVTIQQLSEPGSPGSDLVTPGATHPNSKFVKQAEGEATPRHRY